MPMGSPSSPVIADIIMEELLKKFEQESVNKPRLLTKVIPEWIRNTTSIQIPTDIQWLLSLGPKHALPIDNKEFPLFKEIADGENYIQTIKDKEKQEMERNNLTTLPRDHLNKKTTSVRDKFISDTLRSAKLFLKNHKELLILNAEKGNVTVLMDKSEYDIKMQTIVNDISTYKVLKRDPTNRLQDKNNELVEKMFSNKIIDVKEKNALLCKTANPPRIYGLPKIHKEGNPLRPICSSVNSPSNNLCKYDVKILKNVTMSSVYNVKDAIEFKNKIKDTYVYDDESLVSFDVVSLFPSIPVDLALEIIASKWEDIKEYTYMSKELFLTVRSGMPMGSPSSPVIADIIMEELLKKFEQESVNKPRLLTKIGELN
ncbi:PREDICTED: uncharacterized protein LOC108370180 [Rhagoletis zephyria]|uniref:uncharacterized protein LOC108370180 n=1 Tax=Rhagoletis zephyria TaxID=28612 RepID=UPI0008117D21|nr:PREDICTED: uncharacterized protein LOC108370180 [Rhagoletis zephyria]